MGKHNLILLATESLRNFQTELLLKGHPDIVSVQRVRLSVLAELAGQLYDVLNSVLCNLGESVGHLIVQSFFLAQTHAQLPEVHKR